MNIVARLWRNHNEALLVILLLLLTLGTLNVFSASFVTAGQEMKEGAGRGIQDKGRGIGRFLYALDARQWRIALPEEVVFCDGVHERLSDAKRNPSFRHSPESRRNAAPDTGLRRCHWTFSDHAASISLRSSSTFEIKRRPNC